MSGRPVPPRRATSSIVSAARRTSARVHAERQQRMLEERKHRHRVAGSQGRLDQKPQQHPPAACSTSGVPPESSARMPKRSSSAETRRASARSPVTSAAVPAEPSTAWRSAMAIATASSRSLRRLDQRHAVERGVDIGCGESRRGSAPSHPWCRRDAALPTQAGRAAAQPGQAQPISSTSARLDADPAEQLGQPVLRDGRAPQASAPPWSARSTTCRPSRGRARAGPPLRRGSRAMAAQQFGGRRDRAGGAGGDDRALGRVAAQPLGLEPDQRVAMRRRVRPAAFGEERPASAA